MPASRLPFAFSEAYSSPVDYCSYDQPPGPDKHCNYGEETYLPSRRRSWVDVVDQCSDNTERVSTDASSIADSRSSVPMANLDTLNSGRRRSWEQLVEENEDNDQIEQNLGLGLISPAVPPLPLPYANPALHLMTVRDDGRLARVHLYNKKRRSGSATDGCSGQKCEGGKKENGNASNRTSTMSEFILVPSKTALTSAASSITDDDSRRFRHDFGKAKRSPMGYLCPWTLSRRTTFVMILTVALVMFLTMAIGGYMLRRNIIGRKTIYELKYPTGEEYEMRVRDVARRRSGQSLTTLRLVLKEPSFAEFRLSGVFPYQDVRTVIDFDKKLVISHHLSGDWSSHCFISHLNESAFPTVDALKEAAENALQKSRPVSWLEDWKWRLEPVNDKLRDELYVDPESRAHCGGSMYWLQRIEQDLSAARCAHCHPVCLPSYGVTRLGIDYGRPLLTPLGRDCFWMSSGSNQVSPVGRTLVNSRINANAYLYGTNSGGPSFGQVHYRPPDAPFRPFLQQSQQTGFVSPPDQQRYRNIYYNPPWPDYSPSGYKRV